VTNKIQSTRIKSIDYKFLDQIDFKNIPQNIKNIANQLPNIDSSKGFVLAQKEDGLNLTIVPYSLEFFPYEKKISFHISFLTQKQSFIGAISLLYSCILICKKMHVDSLISRYSFDQLDTLLMSLDLNFHVVEFSRNSIPHVVVEKNFILKNNITKESEYISAFKKNYPIKKMNVKYNQISSETTLNKGESEIYNSITNLQAFSRWLNIDYDQFPKTFLELDMLCKNQSHCKGTKIGSGEKIYYFIENNNTIGALLCPETFKVRRVLKSVWKVLNASNSKVVYTNKHDDWIDSILFLAGFVMVSSENKQDDSLWKWERI
jgi:hypothetical protein